MEENHDEQDRDSEVEGSQLSNNEEEEVNSDGDSMEVSGYTNDNEGENSTYNTNGNSVLAAAAAEMLRRQMAIRTGNHPGLNYVEGLEHEDILSKLKSQVRDLKMHNSQLGDLGATTAANNIQEQLNSLKARAPTTPFLFAPNRGVAIPEDGNFQFTSPMQFPSQMHHFMPQAGPPAANNPGSNPPSTSPQSSEGSGGSNQNNWSFEEQFKQRMFGGQRNIPNYFENGYLGMHFLNNLQMLASSSHSNKSNSRGINNAYAYAPTNGQDRAGPSVSPPTGRSRSPRQRNGRRRSADNMNVNLSAAEVSEEEEQQHSEFLSHTNTTSTTFEQHKQKRMFGGQRNIPNYFENGYLGMHFLNNLQMLASSSHSNKSNSRGINNAYAYAPTNGQDRAGPSVSPPTGRSRSPRQRNGRRSADNMNVNLSAAEVSEEEEQQHSEFLSHTNTTSTTFEQHKQKLYELTDDPLRKAMLDELFSFNQRRGKHNRTPINRLPIMAKTVLDLFELFNLVVARGGLVEVINKKLWQEIIKGLKLPSSITSAAFTLRTQYMKFLFAFECEKYNLSTNEELQAAIDGNRREGRRSSYGAHYENMRPSGRSPNPVQMAQLAAVTRHQQHHQDQQLLSRLSSQFIVNGHHPVTHPPGLGQLNGAPIPGMAMPSLNINFEQYAAAAARILVERGGSPSMHSTAAQADLNRSPSPNNHHSALTAFNNNLVLFNSFLNNNNNVKPLAPQEEALNLSEAAQTTMPVKRERVDKDEEPTSPKKKSRESSNDDASLARVSQPSNNHHSSQRTNIVINNREGDPVNGMVVNMEVNGVAYQGVLFPVSDDKVQTSNKKNGS